jgi:sugar lactone lactonase YvrE
MAETAKLDVLVDGLTFPEGPRWHDGKFWFSDFYSRRVLAADQTGKLETIVEVPQRPSGLGWTRDGKKGLMYFRDPSGNLFEIYCGKDIPQAAHFPRGVKQGGSYATDYAGLFYEWHG